MDYVNEVYPFVRVMHITHEQNPPPQPPQILHGIHSLVK